MGKLQSALVRRDAQVSELAAGAERLEQRLDGKTESVSAKKTRISALEAELAAVR